MKRQRNVIALGLVSFFTDFASSMVTPILPLFVVIVLSEGVDKVGMLTAVTTLISYLLRFLGGMLSDRFDQNKPFLLLGYGMSAICKPLFALAGSWVGIAAIHSAERLGKAVRAAPKDKLISLSATEGDEGKTFGLHKALDVAGEMSGLVVLLILLGIFGSSEAVFRNIFLASLIPGLIALLILQFIVHEKRGGRAKKQRFRLALEPHLRKPILIFAAVSVFMFNEVFFVLRGNELGLPLAGILLMLIGMKIVQIMLSYSTGSAVDRFSSHHLLTVGYLLGLLSMLMLLRPSLINLALAFAMFGAHGVIMMNAIRAFISKTAIDQGAAFGGFYLIYAVATALGTIIIGYLWEFQGVFAAASFSTVGIIVAGFLHVIPRRTTSPVKTSSG